MATAQDYKSKDQMLYTQWKETGSKRALGDLVNHLSGIIYKEVQRQQGSLAPAALSAEAKKWAVHAIRTYDPNKGASLSTHVNSWVQKTRRLNYTYQNAARLPENLQLQYHKWESAIQDLSDEHNRDPTDEEIAEKMGWSKGQVIRYRNMLFQDLTESGSMAPTSTLQFNEQKILLDHIMNQLTTEEKTIWENSRKLSSEELAKKLGINVNRLNYLKTKLKNKVQSIRQEIGYY